jgi:hypothetical protein
MRVEEPHQVVGGVEALLCVCAAEPAVPKTDCGITTSSDQPAANRFIVTASSHAVDSDSLERMIRFER